MPARDRLTFRPTAADSGRILLGRACVAEIRRLELVRFTPEPSQPSLVGPDGGVPFYWRQYGNHQDPERRANARRRLVATNHGARWVELRATGETGSGSARSEYTVIFRADARGRLTCAVQARLTVPAGTGWRVTPHPDHGEAVFCTLWPAGVFSPDGRTPKRFQACLVQRGQACRRINHHHLESPDKQHIRLKPGDRFAWGLEDHNPEITIGPGTRAEAGVCAYMWDTHFALRLCRQHRDVILPPGSVLTAAYTLRSRPRRALQRALAAAQTAPAGAATSTPVYTGGRHTFRTTFRAGDLAGNTAWPWQREVTAGRPADVAFARDTRIGCGDRYSLRLRHRRAAGSRWLATTLGPAFGEPPFRRGGALRLEAMVRTGGPAQARISLRWHRPGRGSVFQVAGYETFASEWVSRADDWVELVIETPPLRPAPDRVHLLLELQGRGTAWFDNVQIQRVDP